MMGGIICGSAPVSFYYCLLLTIYGYRVNIRRAGVPIFERMATHGSLNITLCHFLAGWGECVEGWIICIFFELV